MKASLCIAAFIASAALAVEPAFTIPGATRIETMSDGSQRVALSGGQNAWVTPMRGGYHVRYSDQRPSEIWTKTASGHSVTTVGAEAKRSTRRTMGDTVVRADGSRARYASTRSGAVYRDDSGAATWWTTNRSGATAFRVER